MKGYKFNTEEAVKTAQSQCDVYYDIPNGQPDEVTKHWVGYQLAEMNEPQFYYIIWNDTLNAVLGDPEEFEVIFPPRP